MPRLVLIACGVATFSGAVWAGLDTAHAGLALLLVVVALLALVVAWLESGPDSAKEIALVATLGGAAAAGRVLFAAIPGVQPVTVIVVCTGAALGARAGVAAGAIAAFASNFFLGQGVWTPWQMLAWSICGGLGAVCARFIQRRVPLAAFCFLLGLGFSSFMDVWNWSAFYAQHTWATFVAVQARGFPFDLAHGIGNVVIALVAGPELLRLLARYGRRLHAEVVWS